MNRTGMTDTQRELDHLEIPFHEGCDITEYTTMKIGGKVRLLIVVSTELQLKQVLSHFSSREERFIILGGGSNVVFSDDPCTFPVIVNRSSDITKTGDRLIRINSGTPNQGLLKWCIDHRAGGLEFLGGIPGTVGGAVAVNAGSQGKSIGDYLERADILTEGGEFRTVDNAFFNFSYRHSDIKYKHHAILNVYLKYTADSVENIRQKVQANLQLRKTRHPAPDVWTAGCFFKNIKEGERRISSGQVIDSAGLKGYQSGGIRISHRHANFFINTGSGTLRELAGLENLVREKVLKKCGVVLEREVIYISPDGSKY